MLMLGARVLLVGLCAIRSLPLWCGRPTVSFAACSARPSVFSLCRSIVRMVLFRRSALILFFSLSLALCCASVFWPWTPGESVMNSLDLREHNSVRHSVTVIDLGFDSMCICCGRPNRYSRLFLLLICFRVDVSTLGSSLGNHHTFRNNNEQHSGCIVNASRFPPGQNWLKA